MRYRLAALILFAALSVMNALAAPVPAPSAILDIGPPPKGQTAEEYCKEEIDHLTYPQGMLARAWGDPEVKKLPSVAQAKHPWAWLAKNLRVKEEKEGRRLRLTFHAGSRAEQVVILNALLRVYIRMVVTERISNYKKALHIIEEGRPRLARDIKKERNPDILKRYQEEWDNASVAEADFCAEIARRKQIGVIKWAK